ncbi:MAG: response regulator transcription factor [Flavobacteriales bacterium]|nr:response regulator transcription factor [Flavobacteriales bacterium]
MDKITVLIADDEPPALELMKRYVLQTPFLELVHECNNAIDALKKWKTHPVDLLFLDIKMPGLSGLEMSRFIEGDSKVIFTTAYPEYAIDGYKVNAMDYLLKPFNYEEFLKSAQKVRDWHMRYRPLNLMASNERQFLYFKTEYKQQKVALADVLLFEGLKDYVKIWTVNQPRALMTLMTLKSLEQELSAEKFMRIHRSFIISLDKIDSLERGQVIIGQHRITVSDQYKDLFAQYVAQYAVKK